MWCQQEVKQSILQDYKGTDIHTHTHTHTQTELLNKSSGYESNTKIMCFDSFKYGCQLRVFLL